MSKSPSSHDRLLLPGGGSLPGIGEGEMANGSSGQIDHLYLKNVMLKFIVAVTAGRIEQACLHLLLSPNLHGKFKVKALHLTSPAPVVSIKIEVSLWLVSIEVKASSRGRFTDILCGA